MSTAYITEEPHGFRDVEGSAIRVGAVSSRLSLHAMEVTNWLLAHGASQIAKMTWVDPITSFSTRIYHIPSVDARRLVCVPIIGCASGGGPVFKLKPSGGVDTYCPVDPSMTPTTPWGHPGWQVPIIAADIVDTGLVYHELDWGDLNVYGFSLFEMPRDVLDSTVDTMVEARAGTYSGMESGRHICDGAAGGVPDLLAGISSARAETRRHGGGWWTSDDRAWHTTAPHFWKSVADDVLGTSDFFFPHRSRMLRADDTARAHYVRIRAKYSYTGPGYVDFYASKVPSEAVFTGLTNAFAWHAPDADATLLISCDEDEELHPYISTLEGTTNVWISSMQWIEVPE